MRNRPAPSGGRHRRAAEAVAPSRWRPGTPAAHRRPSGPDAQGRKGSEPNPGESGGVSLRKLGTGFGCLSPAGSRFFGRGFGSFSSDRWTRQEAGRRRCNSDRTGRKGPDRAGFLMNRTAGSGLETRKAVRRASNSNGGVWGRRSRPRHQHPPHGLPSPAARGKRSAAP